MYNKEQETVADIQFSGPYTVVQGTVAGQKRANLHCLLVRILPMTYTTQQGKIALVLRKHNTKASKATGLQLVTLTSVFFLKLSYGLWLGEFKSDININAKLPIIHA